MKSAAVIVLMCLSVALGEEMYTGKYDNVDLDDILGNDRMYNGYMKCISNEGPCTPDATELKEHIPEALETECAKCSDKQKEGIKKVLKFMIEKKPEDWKKLGAIYDKDGKYMQKYESRMKELEGSA